MPKPPVQRGRFLPSLLLGRWRWVFLLCLILGAGVPAGLLITHKVTAPRQYESSALVELHREVGPDARGYAEYVAMETEFLLSGEHLEAVGDALELTARWGKSGPEVVADLRRMVRVHRRDQSNLVEIACRNSYPEDARDVVRALIDWYQLRKRKASYQRIELEMEALEAEVRSMEDVLAEKGKLLRAIVEFSRSPEATATEQDKVMAEEELREARVDEQFVRKTLEALKEEALRKRLARDRPKHYVVIHEEPRIETQPLPLWSPQRAAVASAKLFGLVLLGALLVVGFLELLFPAREY